jgi:REP element-mobilizing transposase RayT
MIPATIEDRLYAHIGGVCRGAESDLIGAGGTANHVHLLLRMSKKVALADVMMDVKKDSSKWIKSADPGMGRFAWQDGYAGLSVGQSQVAALRTYFARQKEHHAKKPFKEELVEFLEKYGVEYDPKYIWE